MIKKASIYDQLELHKLFHVPPSDDSCKCELKNLNRHKIDCPWAKQALFNINNDFRYFYFSPFFKRLKEVFNLIETYEERQKNFY